MSASVTDWSDAAQVDAFMNRLDDCRAHMHELTQFLEDGKVSEYTPDGNDPSRHLSDLDRCIRRLSDEFADTVDAPLYKAYVACERLYPGEGGDGSELEREALEPLSMFDREEASSLVRDACDEMLAIAESLNEELLDAIAGVRYSCGAAIGHAAKFQREVLS